MYVHDCSWCLAWLVPTYLPTYLPTVLQDDLLLGQDRGAQGEPGGLPHLCTYGGGQEEHDPAEACMYVCRLMMVMSIDLGVLLPYIHTYIHTYLLTHKQTYIHTYIHTYIQTYLQRRSSSSGGGEADKKPPPRRVLNYWCFSPGLAMEQLVELQVGR